MYFIAEIGLAHDGSLGIAHSYIDALAELNIDAIKFQMHLPEFESSEYEKFRVNFSYADKTRYEYWERTSFKYEEWKGLVEHCKEKNIDFIISPFSIEACNWSKSLGIKKIKIGSGEVSNHLMIDNILTFADSLILSSGLSTKSEIIDSLNIASSKIDDLTILQCTSSYPTEPEEWGLGFITELKRTFPKLKIGYSDHSGEIYSSLGAIAFGAEVIEFHSVFDKKMFGPDTPSSLNLKQIKKLVNGGRKLFRSINTPYDKNHALKKDYKNLFGKSLSINKNLIAGHTISIDDLETKKPSGYGIDPKNYREIIGKKIKSSMNKGDFLNIKDIII